MPRIWFDGNKTTQTGNWREFVSPALLPGRAFTYEIRARWNEGGRPVDQTRHLTVRAGDHLMVSFLQPAPLQARSYFFAPTSPGIIDTTRSESSPPRVLPLSQMGSEEAFHRMWPGSKTPYIPTDPNPP